MIVKPRPLFFLLILSLLSWSPATADDRSEVRNLVKEKIDIVIPLLRRKDISKKERNEKVLQAMTPIIDFPRMAKLSLGKKHWVGLTKEQRKKFSDIFINRLKESYLEKLDLYSGEDVVVGEAKRVKKRIHVYTHLISKDDKKGHPL